ncbi:hypothetical protein KPH14_003359 [Odynerus spinipes]|uniref:Uncharacterized protein n=1 Tax=Odynerus spinipes TaxID=1348599 RepID=A0AAD9RCP2_9HYME|nr:hypothetical protein KPH14_003359 [Odynerus spinipes]
MVSGFGGVQLITCLWIGCAICSLVQPGNGEDYHLSTRYDKRDSSRAKVPELLLTSRRYGRSEPKIPDGRTRPMKVASRSDMFFLGSRYGKRSLEDKQVIYHPEYPSLDRLDAVLQYVNEARRAVESPLTVARKSEQEDLREDDERQESFEAAAVLPFQQGFQ